MALRIVDLEFETGDVAYVRLSTAIGEIEAMVYARLSWTLLSYAA
jgi:hypothetical protein